MPFPPGRLRAQLVTLEAMLALVLATVLRRVLAMHRWSFLIGRPGPADPTGPTSPGAPGEPDDVGRLVAGHLARAVHRLPLSTSCLDQAVAGSLMLRRRGRTARVVVGMNPAHDPPLHAWLVASGGVLCGSETGAPYAPVTVFTRAVERSPRPG